MEHFVITVNGWKPLTLITKRSTLDVAADLDPPLHTSEAYLEPSNTSNMVLYLKTVRKEGYFAGNFWPG